MMKLRPFRHHATRDLTGRICRGEGRTCWEPSADRGAVRHVVFVMHTATGENCVPCMRYILSTLGYYT